MVPIMLLPFILLFASGVAHAGTCSNKQYEKFSAVIESKDPAKIDAMAKATSCLQSTSQKSLLALAAEKADFDTFNRLIAGGANVNLRTITDGYCRYQILHVIQEIRKTDAFPFVKALVEAGADLQSCAIDKDGECGDIVCETEKFPIGQAAEKGDWESVELLASRHARIAGDELFYSAPDDARITARLIELGADPAISQNTPLFNTKSPEVIRLLVKAGADINFRQFGYGHATPLAVYSKPDVFAIEPVIAAIDMGADLRIPMTIDIGWPCAGVGALLCWAGQLTPPSLVAMYYGLKSSALIDVDQRDANGATALMRLAAFYFYRAGRDVKTQVLQLLIAKGANVNALDKNGRSVLEYYREYPRENAKEINILLEAGAGKSFPHGR